MLSSFRDNGAYVFLGTVAAHPFNRLRNRLLAAQFGVRKLSIGPRSHLRGLASISLGEDFSAAEGLWLEAVTHHGNEHFSPKLVIGSHVRVSRWSHIACTHSVSIGDHVLIGSKVIITDHNHGTFGSNATPPSIPPDQRPLERNRFVMIGANVWLGDGVVVCPGVTIGEGSVVGANAVVTADIPAFCLAVGVPARVVKRFDSERGTWIKA